MFSSSRHISELIVLIVLIAVTILSGQYWQYFTILPITAFIFYLIDVMFYGYNDFMYEPNYRAWCDANDAVY